jgi:hypothetical protein
MDIYNRAVRRILLLDCESVCWRFVQAVKADIASESLDVEVRVHTEDEEEHHSVTAFSMLGLLRHLRALYPRIEQVDLTNLVNEHGGLESCAVSINPDGDHEEMTGDIDWAFEGISVNDSWCPEREPLQGFTSSVYRTYRWDVRGFLDRAFRLTGVQPLNLTQAIHTVFKARRREIADAASGATSRGLQTAFFDFAFSPDTVAEVLTTVKIDQMGLIAIEQRIANDQVPLHYSKRALALLELAASALRLPANLAYISLNPIRILHGKRLSASASDALRNSRKVKLKLCVGFSPAEELNTVFLFSRFLAPGSEVSFGTRHDGGWDIRGYADCMKNLHE